MSALPSPRRTRLVIVVGLVLAILATGCSRGGGLGSAEAIEILVLDGVARPKAECIITSLEGAIDLEKITGIRTDIDDDEIALLATANAGCAAEVGSVGGVVGGAGLPEELEGFGADVDVDGRIDDLVVGGLDPVVAECLRSSVWASGDPQAAVVDLGFLSEAVSICQRSATATP